MLNVTKLFEPDMPVLNVSDVVELEQATEAAGTSLLTLMTRAGAAAAEVACELLEEADASGKKIAILAGSGNNGGDGWVAASNLADTDYDVTLVSKAPAEELSAEPARTAAIEAMQGANFRVVLSPTKQELESLLGNAALIVDAILGTGFAHSEVRTPYNEWIDCANETHSAHNIPILAVDCPSGLNAQTGNAATSCINARTTITMIAAKTGLVQPEAKNHVGTLLVAPIGVEV